MRFYDSIDPRVFVLKLTPGVNPGILDALADSYDAVILETFGIGGIPEFGESGKSSKRRFSAGSIRAAPSL